MKYLLTAIILLISLIRLQAQDYYCVLNNKIQYYTNSNHYLRGIRIDSTKTINGNTVLYPYKTARGDYFDWINTNALPMYKGGSWLGESITIKNDGTHLFKTQRNDTIIIKTQAQLGDEWTFYNDTASRYYTAKVTKVDTMTVRSGVDSIKEITLTAHDVVTSFKDDIDKKTIILSKKNGLVKTLDLYVFPIQQSQQMIRNHDYFTEEARGLDFYITEFSIPREKDIYNYNIGDEYQFYGDHFHESLYNTVELNQVLNRQDITATETKYTIRRIRYSRYLPDSRKAPETRIDTITKTVDGMLFTLDKLPEEWGSSTIIKYNHKDTQFCITDKLYGIGHNYVGYTGNTARLTTAYRSSTTDDYKMSIGDIYDFDFAGNQSLNPYRKLTYYNIDNKKCGVFRSVNIEELQKENLVTIYPNPANNKVVILIPKKATNIQISNVTGQQILQGTYNAEKIEINTSTLNTGVYFITVQQEKMKYTKKLLIVH